MIGALFSSRPSPFSENHPRRNGGALRFSPNDHLRAKGSCTAHGWLYTPVDNLMKKNPGDNGFEVSFLHRIPFRQDLLEYLGEIPLFSALYNRLRQLDRLIHVLDRQLREILRRLLRCVVRRPKPIRKCVNLLLRSQ